MSKFTHVKILCVMVLYWQPQCINYNSSKHHSASSVYHTASTIQVGERISHIQETMHGRVRVCCADLIVQLLLCSHLI